MSIHRDDVNANAYRDDLEAALARIDALEVELEQLRATSMPKSEATDLTASPRIRFGVKLFFCSTLFAVLSGVFHDYTGDLGELAIFIGIAGMAWGALTF